MKNRIDIKLILLGNTFVGKTSLTLRFLNNVFNEFQEPTLGAAFFVKKFNHNNQLYKFEVWDTAGSEKYKSLLPIYYRNSKVALIVYDITNLKSFEDAKNWIRELKEILPDCFIILIGNKSDLIEKKKVDIDNSKTFAKKNNINFIETSAKTGYNVDKIFKIIIKNIKIKIKTKKSEYNKDNIIKINNTNLNNINNLNYCC
tara:strand:+ start:2766 stop:3368 length:603 start_codon:yes stop_codon:yes gene_type:complete